MGWEFGVGGRFYRRSGPTGDDTNSHAGIWKWVLVKWEHTAQSGNSFNWLEQDFVASKHRLNFGFNSVGIKAKLQI